MTYIHKSKYIIEIPIHWTAEQADAVFDFLAQVQTAIFDAYDQELTEIAQAQNLAQRLDEDRLEDEILSDDIPF